MAGVLVELIISWILLWFVCKEHLSVLGFRPTKDRIAQLGVGLLISALCCTAYQIMTTEFAGNGWRLNTKVTSQTMLEGSRWILTSVLYEELIFRGALLYIAIKKLGLVKGCVISGICFGVYHWFTFGAFGNPVMMAFTFFMTGIVGLSWAHAFAKTKSMYLPIGLHFGWNTFYMLVFSNGSMGWEPIFIRINQNQPQGIVSLLIFLFQVFALPALTLLYLNRLSRKETVIVKDQPSFTSNSPNIYKND
jgi:uncharacterized protein